MACDKLKRKLLYLRLHTLKFIYIGFYIFPFFNITRACQLLLATHNFYIHRGNSQKDRVNKYDAKIKKKKWI